MRLTLTLVLGLSTFVGSVPMSRAADPIIATEPLTDLHIVAGRGGTSPTAGFVLVPYDCNSGIKGSLDLFVTHIRNPNARPITDIKLVAGSDPKHANPESGFTRATGTWGKKAFDGNLNFGVRPVTWKGVTIDYTPAGQYIYLCYKQGSGDAINDIVVMGGPGDVPTPKGYTRCDLDLNKGAKGDYIYLFYRKGPVAKSPFAPSAGGLDRTMLKNMDQEYEVSRVQINSTQAAVHLQKISAVRSEYLAPGIARTYEVTVKTGVSKERIIQICVDIGISKTEKKDNFEQSVNIKFGMSETNKFKTWEEREKKDTIPFAEKPYERWVVYAAVTDVFRVVDLPSGNTIKNHEIIREDMVGYFVTKKKGDWGDGLQDKP
jgi:hypothetical protein